MLLPAAYRSVSPRGRSPSLDYISVIPGGSLQGKIYKKWYGPPSWPMDLDTGPEICYNGALSVTRDKSGPVMDNEPKWSLKDDAALAELLSGMTPTERKESWMDRKIGYHRYTTGLAEDIPCSNTCKWWCKMGLHRWAYPGGYCECCGVNDA